MIDRISNLNGRDQRKIRGAQAEQIAEHYLREHGYTIVERNWRCRSGEIDIVASIEQTIVIVEVRSRGEQSHYFGTPVESVTLRKMKQIRDTASVYLYQTRQSGASVRFDVIGIVLKRDGTAADLQHITEAF